MALTRIRAMTTKSTPCESTPYEETPWWLWTNILSLDAPMVTLVWQWWFAKTLAVVLTLEQYLVLFLTVWLIYALDRWLDAWKLDMTKPHSSRHGFYLRYRKQSASIWGVLLASTATLVLLVYPSKTLVTDYYYFYCVGYTFYYFTKKARALFLKKCRLVWS
jgi:hypothetical protein